MGVTIIILVVVLIALCYSDNDVTLVSYYLRLVWSESKPLMAVENVSLDQFYDEVVNVVSLFTNEMRIKEF